MTEYRKTEWQSKGIDGSIPDDAPSINAQNLKNIEEGIYDCNRAIDGLEKNFDNFKTSNIFDILSGEMVWENTSSNSNFSSQDIIVNLSKYKRFVIVIKDSKDDDDYYEYIITQKNKRHFLSCCGIYSGSYGTGRSVIITDEKICFGDGVYAGNLSRNNYGIPISVMAYKY